MRTLSSSTSNAMSVHLVMMLVVVWFTTMTVHVVGEATNTTTISRSTTSIKSISASLPMSSERSVASSNSSTSTIYASTSSSNGPSTPSSLSSVMGSTSGMSGHDGNSSSSSVPPQSGHSSSPQGGSGGDSVTFVSTPSSSSAHLSAMSITSQHSSRGDSASIANTSSSGTSTRNSSSVTTTTTTPTTTTTTPPTGTTQLTDYVVDVVVPQSATEGALFNTIAFSTSFQSSSLRSVQCLPTSTTGDGRNVTTKLCMVTVDSFASGSLLVTLINSRNLAGEVNVLVAVVSLCGERNSSSVACVNQTHQGAAASSTSGGTTASVEFGGSKVAAVICIVAGVVALAAGIAAVLIHKGNKERDEVSTAEAFHKIQQRMQSKRQSSVVTLNTSNATYDDL